MADEIQKPTHVTPEDGETPSQPDESLEEVQEKTVRDARAIPLENIPDEEIPPEIKEFQEAESDEARETRREAEAALNKPIEAIENAIESTDNAPSQAVVQAAIAHHADEPVVFLGRTFNTNIYTFIFGVLAALTVFEIITAELLPNGFIRTMLLLIPSLIKALLVMAFYMHLREDSRMFTLAIAMPIGIGVVALLFLLAVPTSGY